MSASTAPAAYDFSALSDRALDTMLRIVGNVIDTQAEVMLLGGAIDPANRERLLAKEAALTAEFQRREDALLAAVEAGVAAGTFRVFDPSKGVEQFA